MARHCRIRTLAWLCWALALSACQRPAPPASTSPQASAGLQADRLSVLRAGDETGFARAEGPRRFAFPQDHGPHPDFRHEWWYLTGQLQGASGEWFGFELTVFRLALQPAGKPSDAVPGSAWRARQVYAAHFAITDVGAQRFFHATRYARDALTLAGAQTRPFAVHVADWSLTAVPDATTLHWQLDAADGDYALQLELQTAAPPVLNGEAGLSRKADLPGAASYYYSMPRLQASGRIVHAGVARPVKGLAWLDREWGSGSLGPQQQGWDWFALDLADGSSLMFYALRDRGGERDPHSAGTFVDPAGQVTPLTSLEVQIDVQREWDSPRGGRYPAQWRLSVPSQQLTLQVTPMLADQELNTAPRYWEGAVQVQGERRGAPVSARGYVELVGYAQAQASATSPSASTAPGH